LFQGVSLMKYGIGKKDADARTEHNRKVAKTKSDLSVMVIKHNKATEKLLQDLQAALVACRTLSTQFGNQRELLARSRMTERVINSSLKMIASNKLALWMINEKEIEEGLE